MNFTLRYVGCFPLVYSAVFCLTGQVNEGREKRTFTHEREVETAFVWETPPRWEGGKLVGYLHNHSSGPIIYTMDRDGTRDETLFTLKDGALIHVSDLAGSPNGEIAIVASALTSDTGGTTFLARISAEREHQTITRTWPYCPKVVTFAADGNIWTIGNMKSEDGTQDLARNVLPALRSFRKDAWIDDAPYQGLANCGDFVPARIKGPRGLVRPRRRLS